MYSWDCYTHTGGLSLFCLSESEAFLARIIILLYSTKVNANFKQVLLNSTEMGCMQMYSLKHPFIDYAQLLTIHIPL